MTETFDDPTTPTDIYSAHPIPVWEAAREEYLRGESSTDICRRHGLARSTFHARAAREGWRRMDQLPRTVTPFIRLTGEVQDLEFWDLSEMATMRLRQAVMSGRSADAAGWLTMVRQLRQESIEFDPPSGWQEEETLQSDKAHQQLIRDSLDALDQSSTSPASPAGSFTPRNRPHPETPAPAASFRAPAQHCDAGSGRSAR